MMLEMTSFQRVGMQRSGMMLPKEASCNIPPLLLVIVQCITLVTAVTSIWPVPGPEVLDMFESQLVLKLTSDFIFQEMGYLLGSIMVLLAMRMVWRFVCHSMRMALW